jgi:hypothetical protein
MSQAMTYEHEATYSPEDDKIRLYFAHRIDRPEWDRLKSLGFSWCMHQSKEGGPDMVAVWSTKREDAALELCGMIGDEDQPMAERAAMRAERFARWGEKRETEAQEYASAHAAGPAIHAHQSEARAERAAKAHDRLADKAEDQWSKAEYWQSRTARVIAHAMHKMDAGLRHRRIKGIEADIRKIEADNIPSKIMRGVEHVIHYCGQQYADKGHDCVGIFGQGRAKWPRSFQEAEGPRQTCQRTLAHLKLRLAYEIQMLGEQGGTMADAEIEPGGFIGSHQIQKITKDRAGRVSKVYYIGPHPYKADTMSLHAISAERIKPGSYRAPTEDERAAFAAQLKAAKSSKPKAPPLINPTPEDAAKLQAVFNEAAALWYESRDQHFSSTSYKAEQAAACRKIEPLSYTQAAYSERSEGEYAPCQTIDLAADWTEATWRNKKTAAFRVRVMTRSGIDYGPARVVILNDKPTKPLPAQEVANAAHAQAS